MITAQQLRKILADREDAIRSTREGLFDACLASREKDLLLAAQTKTLFGPVKMNPEERSMTCQCGARDRFSVRHHGILIEVREEYVVYSWLPSSDEEDE